MTVNRIDRGNNTLVVIPTTNSVKQGGDPVSLVTAPKNTQSNIFTLNPVSINAGFHSFTPQLDVLRPTLISNGVWRDFTYSLIKPLCGQARVLWISVIKTLLQKLII